MWPGSKHNSGVKSFLLTLGLVTIINTVSAQQLVRDLQQDWLQYNDIHGGYIPVEGQRLDIKTISFTLSNEEYKNFYLVIGVSDEATIFEHERLIAKLSAGYSNFAIDSLQHQLKRETLFISVYGEKLLPGLKTEIRTQPLIRNSFEGYQPARYANDFSNFIYSAGTVLLLFFVILRIRFPELMDQYLLFQRSFRFKTIDELIYKIPYLRVPNLLFLVITAMFFGLATLSFMYFVPGELSVFGINPTTSGFWSLQLYWLGLSALILTGLVLKYVYTILISSVFSLNISNVHYASSLRLILPLGMGLALLSLAQFIFPNQIFEVHYWILLIGGLVIMELTLFFKLTLLSTHTLLYIIVYLCATEIIPVVFLFKLYTA